MDEAVDGDTVPGYVEVRRTGGITGRAVSGRVDLDPAAGRADARVAEVQALVARVRPGRGLLARLLAVRTPSGRPHPDRFGYTITVAGADPVVLAESQVHGDVRRLVELVLELGTTS
ncbi:protealysin inhibitor emfourin [Nocardioides sp. AE5]|uniref:protealysin inhibitor emfourin n=1 Tax=Nocardioides sp. AE5 TaxID=2962573 RepID=UPI00288121C1|nr:protealysin inhibitor emfourin [Nocardioides sp. AE5]MDT0200837.1 hypothetical protein [Nocardioides sp. AE5]